MSQFTESLVVTPLPDGKTWIILNDFGYEIGEEGSGDIIREVEATLLMNLDVATVIRDWLSEKIDAGQKARVLLEDARRKGVDIGDTGKN